MRQRPLLLLDVDGVLVPFGTLEYPGHYSPVEGRDIHLSSLHREWIAELAEVFDIVWATSWEHRANEVLARELGLPEFPVIEFRAGRADTTWKLGTVRAYVGDRPVAWVEDDLWDDAHEWARSRAAPTLLVRTISRVGLTREQVDELMVFARSLPETE